MTSLRALREPRHACHACGACCHGMRIRLLGDEETGRILSLGAELGVDDPVDNGRLRFVDGHCVFLGDNQLCRIHQRFGAASKPVLCRQYPAVLVHTESDTRIGIDPGCFTLFKTWREGDPLAADAPLVPHASTQDPDQAAVERAILAMAARPDASIGGLVRFLTHQPPGDTLPEGIAGRWTQRLQSDCLSRLLARPETGAPVRDALTPVVMAARRWDPNNPPPWPVLDPEQEAFAIEVVRRLIFLRLLHAMPSVATAGLLAVLGAVAAGWANPDPKVFGPAVVAWGRALRAPAFWMALVSSPEQLRSLALGECRA